jgi:hypothetical protein
MGLLHFLGTLTKQLLIVYLIFCVISAAMPLIFTFDELSHSFLDEKDEVVCLGLGRKTKSKTEHQPAKSTAGDKISQKAESES